MAQRGGVVDHDDVARERQRGEVGGAQQRRRAGRPQRQHETAPRRGRRGGRAAAAASAPRRRRGAARAGAWRARGPSARRRRARGARRRGRRWRCGDRAAGVRVGVDGRSLVGGGARGVAHYTAALLEALASAYPDDEYRVLLPRGVATVPAGVRPVRHELPARVLFGAAAVAGRPRLDALLGGCDVVWAPAPAPLAVGATPFVLTVHDRSWEIRPQDFTPLRAALARGGPPAAAGAARRARAVRHRGGARRADPRVGPRSRPRANRAARAAPAPPSAASPPHPYFLSVGALEPRKAPGRARRGLPPRARARPGGGADRGGRRPGQRRGAAGVRRLGHVEDLGSLYAGALAVVLPSWLEGFGLTPVEGDRRGHARDRQRPPGAARGARRRRALRDAGRRGRPRRRAAARGAATRRCASGCWRPAARRSRR